MLHRCLFSKGRVEILKVHAKDVKMDETVDLDAIASNIERMKNNLNATVLLCFGASALCFLLVYLVRQPAVNLVFMVLAMLSSNCAACLMWNQYCPSLRDTGMVSGATGFLDFASYMAAAISSKLFANAVGSIGWGNLILVWTGLMCVGVAVALARPKNKNKGEKYEIVRYCKKN